MRTYEFVMEEQPVSTACELLLVGPPPVGIAQVLRVVIGAAGSVGSEMSRWQLWRATTFNTASGLRLTGIRRDLSDATTQCAVYSLTGQSNASDAAPIISRPFNWLNGDDWVPASTEDRILIPPNNKYITMVLADAPKSQKLVTVSILLGEIS